MIAPDTLRDAVNWLPENNVANLSGFMITKDKKKIIYQYPVNADTDWLNIIYNEDAVLRYKLNVKNDKVFAPKREELSMNEISKP